MASVAESKKNKAINAIKTNEKKWSKELMDAGWTAFPSIIVEKQFALGIDALDVNIILYLSTYWWEAENKPHPSKKVIADAIGVCSRTVQRRIAKMEELGFMRREYRTRGDLGNNSNKYHFDGLIEAIKPFAQEKIEHIQERQAVEEARRKSKKPVKLKTIDGGKQ